LLEVVEAMDGRIRGSVPHSEAHRGVLDRRLQAEYDKIVDLVRRRLRKVTIADLVSESK
jgi:hypothetical protein